MNGGLPVEQLPAAQQQGAQGIDPFELLNQQHSQQMEQIENLFAGGEDEIYSKAQYNLDTLWQKYNIELRYLQGTKLKADEKRKKLNSLNQKYELAFTTAKERVRPDVDKLNQQKQQLLQRTESGRMVKETRLNQIKDLVEKGIIQDPYAALQEQLQVMGYSVPLSALKPPDPMEQYAAEIRRQAMEALSTYPEAKRKSTQISRAVERRTRKPGTMAEGVAAQLAGVRVPAGRPRAAVTPKYRQNRQTGEKQMSTDGGKTWQTIG